MAGLAACARSLSSGWKPVLVRFAGAFLVLTGLWWGALSHVYLFSIATVGRVLMPLVEARPGTRYAIEGSAIFAVRRLGLPQGETVTIHQPIWVAGADYGLVLLGALILATPGWSRRERARLLGLGLPLLMLADVAFLLVNIEQTQWRLPAGTPYGAALPPGFSPAKRVLFDWLYAFFEFMGRGFFPLLTFVGLLAFAWRPLGERAVAGVVGRNDPCPCRSGMKYKRCCGA